MKHSREVCPGTLRRYPVDCPMLKEWRDSRPSVPPIPGHPSQAWSTPMTVRVKDGPVTGQNTTAGNRQLRNHHHDRAERPLAAHPDVSGEAEAHRSCRSTSPAGLFNQLVNRSSSATSEPDPSTTFGRTGPKVDWKIM